MAPPQPVLDVQGEQYSAQEPGPEPGGSPYEPHPDAVTEHHRKHDDGSNDGQKEQGPGFGSALCGSVLCHRPGQ